MMYGNNLSDRVRELESENERLKKENDRLNRPGGPAERERDREALQKHREAMLHEAKSQTAAMQSIYRMLESRIRPQ